MLTTAEIRGITFSRSMGGYKQEEVDVLLDKIEADYAAFERTVKEYESKIEALTQENQSLKASQNSIQNVLINAQKLADQIVQDAKDKSDEIVSNAESNISFITAKEKELSSAFELKAKERKDALEKELADMVKTAQIRADSIKAASEDSVARQQMLYDKLKMEVAAFKAAVSAKYKEHLEVLRALPDNVPMDPKEMAELVAASVDKAPLPESFLPSTEKPADNVPEKPVEKVIPDIPEKSESGFIVDTGSINIHESEE